MSIRKPLSRRYGFFMFSCALLAVSASASSGSIPYGPDVTVRYSDLDLNTVDGADELLRRINKAAMSVCNPIVAGETATLRGRKKRDACVLKLTAETVAEINRPLLLAAHESALKKSKSKGAMPG